MDDGDALRYARLLLDRYGENAAEMAALCADVLMTAGDAAGQQAWLRIMGAVGELARTERHAGEAQHQGQGGTGRHRIRPATPGLARGGAGSWAGLCSCFVQV